ncbi:hypothetical protein BKA56DRAFT_625840 [Ilyonectria sp. MPI-CAGE-AT-0026]|nr:hypothetical protein BKA56DRAFT_625840 [Ilyonectria sp. MPI-CAGE-AT-0026]
MRSAAAGSTVFATFRGERSVADQLRDIDTDEIRTEVSLMSKIKIQYQDYVLTEWLHRKKRGRKLPIDPYGWRLTKVIRNREKGDFWLYNQCNKKKEVLLYALINSGISGALRHLKKDYGLLIGERHYNSIVVRSRVLVVKRAIAEYIKKNRRHRLALRRLRGAHSSKNISPTLREVLLEYEISADKLGCFTSDNADANDGAVNEIITTLLRNVYLQKHRIRYTNYIYNLSATSYLEGKLKNVLKSLESQPAEQAALQKIINFLEEWQPTGAIVRIHNL